MSAMITWEERPVAWIVGYYGSRGQSWCIECADEKDQPQYLDTVDSNPDPTCNTCHRFLIEAEREPVMAMVAIEWVKCKIF